MTIIYGNPDQTAEYGEPHPEATAVEGAAVTVYDPTTERWLALQWSQAGAIRLAGGGVDHRLAMSARARAVDEAHR